MVEIGAVGRFPLRPQETGEGAADAPDRRPGLRREEHQGKRERTEIGPIGDPARVIEPMMEPTGR